MASASTLSANEPAKDLNLAQTVQIYLLLSRKKRAHIGPTEILVFSSRLF